MEADEGERLPIWKIILLIESVALAIGAVSPVVPSKTGSDFNFADWFFEDPSYLQKVFVDFVGVNLIIAVLALIFFVILKIEARRGAP
jgi:hypothetical protein